MTLIRGYAAIFNIRDTSRDLIVPGAFSRCLDQRFEQKDLSAGRFPLLWQHRPDLRFGWVESVIEDEVGLYMTASLDNPNSGPSVATIAGKVTGLSFGFRPKRFDRSKEGRTLFDIDLFEVSVVSFPCHPLALVKEII